MAHKMQWWSVKALCRLVVVCMVLASQALVVERNVASAHRHGHHRKGHQQKHRKPHDARRGRHSARDDGGEGGQPRMRGQSFGPSAASVFDVLEYGAIGDGETDDTQAFLGAWQQACRVENAIFEVPQYFTFVVRPITFSGPCCANLVFQIDGTIMAPASPNRWGAAKNLLQWMSFVRLHDMVVQGPGFVDGQGAAWWPNRYLFKGKKSEVRPTAIRFYGSYNVTVRNLKIINSPQTHLKFDNCVGVKVSNISIHSPGYSPNTDGIHLQNTQNVEISDSYIENGDDCISIQTGSSNLNIHDVICEAGHGISLGGLGRGQTQACVSNVTVHDVIIRHSQNGVRIKTWQGGFGSVKSVSYKNVYVVNISNPIIIDQYYCDASKCNNQTAAVEVSGITYHNIRGTYSKSSPLHFACSDSIPCTSITLAQIELLPQHGYYVDDPFCWNIYGITQTPTIPPLRCLQRGLPASSSAKGIRQSSLDDAC